MKLSNMKRNKKRNEQTNQQLNTEASVSKSIYCKVLSMVSTLGNNVDNYHIDIANGKSAVKNNTNEPIHSKIKNYPLGILTSEIKALSGLTINQKTQQMVEEIFEPLDFSLSVEDAIFYQLPEQMNENNLLTQLEEQRITPEHLIPLSSSLPMVNILQTIETYLQTQPTACAYLLVADSQVNKSFYSQQAENTVMACHEDDQGYIPGEGAILLQFSLSPIENAVQISSINSQQSFNSASNNSSTSAHDDYMISASQAYLNATPTATNRNSEVITISNLAFKLEKEWSQLRLNLPLTDKLKLPKRIMNLSYSVGIAGVAAPWFTLAYAQGQQGYLLNKTENLLMVDACEQEQRALLAITIKPSFLFNQQAQTAPNPLKDKPA